MQESTKLSQITKLHKSETSEAEPINELGLFPPIDEGLQGETNGVENTDLDILNDDIKEVLNMLGDDGVDLNNLK